MHKELDNVIVESNISIDYFGKIINYIERWIDLKERNFFMNYLIAGTSNYLINEEIKKIIGNEEYTKIDYLMRKKTNKTKAPQHAKLRVEALDWLG